VRVSAAGNRFAVLDAFTTAPEVEPASLVRELVQREGDLDGLLVLGAGTDGADCSMLVHNRDGSRPEACGNGLRCIGKVARERGYVPAELVVATDAGPRRVRCREENGVVVEATAEMGEPRVVALDETLAVGASPLSAHLIDMGNPHCVLFVADIDSAPVSDFGPRLEHHVRFRRGTNVSFAESRADRGGLRVRTWERGVGETASCGTGASAAAVAALLTDRTQAPVHVATRGGELVVDWEGEGPLWLTGPLE